MALLLLLLSFLVAPAFSDTQFVFSGNITCKWNRPYTYYIQVIEMDHLSDDLLSKDQLVTSFTSTIPYTITATDNGDGPWNYYYDILILVHHDCRGPADYSHMTLRLPTMDFWIMDGTHYKTIDIDISGTGDLNDWDAPELLPNTE